MRSILVALALAACGGEVKLDGIVSDDGGDGGAGGTATGGTGGDAERGEPIATGGEGGSPVTECEPYTVCREKAGVCDNWEICTAEGTCPADEVFPQGADPHDFESCAGSACGGVSVDCPVGCAPGEDWQCISGWHCAADGWCYPPQTP
jgi:hypothetical protein